MQPSTTDAGEEVVMATAEHNVIQANPENHNNMLIPRTLSLTELYRAIEDVLVNKSAPDQLITSLIGMTGDPGSKVHVADQLIDVIVQCTIESEFLDDERRDTLYNLVRLMVKANLIPIDLALERFEIDTSAALGVIGDKKQFTRTYNRLRTKLYFKQKKFNLLREENEGFAKILTQLSLLDKSNIDIIYDTIMSTIGFYRVDPNRVLDLVIEVFEYCSRAEHEVYLDFINRYYDNNQKLTQLLILKITFYTSQISDFRVIPQSFYRLMALLLHYDKIDLEDIYPYLYPLDTKILELHKKLVDEARHFARKYNMAVVGEEKPIKTVRESMTDEERHIHEVDNHKINLCAHLVDIGDWTHTMELARKLPEFYCLASRRVATATCDLINYLIDPLYLEHGLPKPLNAKIKPAPRRKMAPPQATSVADLQKTVYPMLIAVGPFLSINTLLIYKVIRILRHVLTQEVIEAESQLFQQTLDVINESILPAVSLTRSNPCLARELWSTIKGLKYHHRYRLYHNWREEGSNPTLLYNRGHIFLLAKHHMKRLSKETSRLIGRHLGKLCYSNPVITLHYIIVQIQSYDNLISLVVDALRFLPQIAHDALIYCVLEALSDPNKSKKSADGLALAPWLTNISAFSANVILRYKIEFTSFLEFIANQLKAGNSLDLVLLTDLIQKMTGIETIQAITDERIEALMGGDILRTECAYFNRAKNTRKPSARLREALIESRLAMPLCILMAQLRDSLFFSLQDSSPLKLVGKLYDQCQETLVQYGVFLSMNLSIDDYINFLPPLDKLLTEYKLDPDSAFFLARPMIFHKIKSKYNELKQSVVNNSNVEEGEAPELSPQASGIKFVEAARSIIDPIAEAIQPSLIEKYRTNNLNSRLFVIFWTLSMSDIEVPINSYEREIQRIKAVLNELSKAPEDDSKRAKERERYSILIHKLKQEQAGQIEHTNYIRMYLESEKNNLFRERSGYDHVYLESRQFVQHCLFARSILTAYDARYSARFLIYLHELKVEDYPTIICLDRLFCDLTYMMGACTENEATHYGRFLCNILKTTSYWHSDPKIYHDECEEHPGSIINIENSAHINYDTYRDICFKWHYRLTRAFTISLESNNYVQIRNALVVMISIIDYYPAIKHFGKGIGMKIEAVRTNEKDNRQDLYALATAYAGRLDEKKPMLIPEASFHPVDSSRKSESKNDTSKSEAKTDSSRTSDSKHEAPSKTESSKTDSRKKESSRDRTDSSRDSSKSRARSSSSHRERHSSTSSKKRARHE